MQSCIRLLTEAARLRPQSASYALNLSHAHEILCDFHNSYYILTSFCKKNLKLRVGKKGFSCEELLLALDGNFKEKSRGGVMDDKYDFSGFKNEFDDGILTISKDMETYSDDDLDVLALAFTAVKIAYLEGRNVCIYIIYIWRDIFIYMYACMDGCINRCL